MWGALEGLLEDVGPSRSVKRLLSVEEVPEEATKERLERGSIVFSWPAPP